VLYSTAFRILGDAQEAEEAIQDVFVQIWNKAATFDVALGAPFHWALGITRNRCIDRIRARQRRTRLYQEVMEESTIDPILCAPPPHAHLREEELAAVHSAVKGLPHEQQQAIEMAFFGGLTHLEIAETLNQPLGTIKARIRRGMFKLRETLQPYV
jgi:RNA polymerase sigma-70 factor (ECF subfamily)